MPQPRTEPRVGIVAIYGPRLWFVEPVFYSFTLHFRTGLVDGTCTCNLPCTLFCLSFNSRFPCPRPIRCQAKSVARPDYPNRCAKLSARPLSHLFSWNKLSDSFVLRSYRTHRLETKAEPTCRLDERTPAYRWRQVPDPIYGIYPSSLVKPFSGRTVGWRWDRI